ncbi:hypothetical protein A5784_35260 [Mycobacterium sp. 852013-50091_SCH5140682]|uniref:hypothetical protein n=1 Tax=Mycobacterium sp. 852013-50091_SCH5140682 TaxID=1834109 RepID=UPI0007E948AD|nr:hypothetical protein [Mycobacterium sp. 852013-50091_SCH5140682]OBC11455.1 hypothetical protein A5784_35260 [Mycobacterium sp. 852013-50091_SCH5140682]
MPAQHICPRCGHEDRCEYGSWADRHPVLSTIAGLFTITLMSMMFSVYPVAAFTMTAFAGIWAGVRLAIRSRERRAGLAARADWEHAQVMAQPATPVQRMHAPTNPPPMAPRHVMNVWPTSRIQTGQQR